MAPVRIQYFSDILCIWAYVGERRVTELAQAFGDQIAIEPRFCSVFPDAHDKIGQGWKNRGGFAGFNRHLIDVAAQFPHITLNDQIWLGPRPRTSASPHMFVKAVEALDTDQPPQPYLQRQSTRIASALRHGFFTQARDISDWRIHREIATEQGVDYDAVSERIASSEAIAALAADLNLAQQQGVSGSPTFIMNDGRQRLFGNVGYRLLEANVQELLRRSGQDEASWC